MGGGAMFRGVARLVGATSSIGAAAAVGGNPSITSGPPVAYCHVRGLEQHLTSSSRSLLEHEAPPQSSKSAAEAIQYSDTEDWHEEEEWAFSAGDAHQRLVFCPAPTANEVDEAVKELHAAALHLSIPVPGGEDSCSQPSMENVGGENGPGVVIKQEVVASQQAPSSFTSQLGMLAVGSSSVYEAFRLLQKPQVQDAVKSLALDPNVWKAVMTNEKVVELTQSLQEADGTSTGEISKGINEANVFAKITSKVCDYVTGAVVQLLGKVVDIVSSMFTSVEKTFFSKDGMDKTVASCMMLAVAVLLVVVIKRTAI